MKLAQWALKHWINVDPTSWRWINVYLMVFRVVFFDIREIVLCGLKSTNNEKLTNIKFKDQD